MPVVQARYTGRSVEADERCFVTKLIGNSPCGNDNYKLYQALDNFIYDDFDSRPDSLGNYNAELRIQYNGNAGYKYSVDKGFNLYRQQDTSKISMVIPVSPSSFSGKKIKIEDVDGFTVGRILSAEWAGSIYDINGLSVGYPELTISDGDLTVDSDNGYYGSIVCVYEIAYDTLDINYDFDRYSGPDKYKLAVTLQADGCDDELIEIKIRPCISSVSIGGGSLPVETARDTSSRYDYCTRKLLGSDLDDAPEYLGITPGACGE